MIFRLSSKCPSECLPRITHVPAKGFSLGMYILQLPAPLEGCVPDTCVCCQVCGLCCARRQGWGTWFHDISGRKHHLPVGSVLKRTSIVWHVNHDAACLAPLNANLPGDSNQESSLFKMSFPIFCVRQSSWDRKKKKKKADWFYRNTLSGQLWLHNPVASPTPSPANIYLCNSFYMPDTVPSILHRRIHLILNRKMMRQKLVLERFYRWGILGTEGFNPVEHRHS